MSKISLRAYNQEIETLINRGQTEEAIGHCKYILKIFPKHIETYKLLGKAFLEAQRYTEASDVLARVLSVVPDDFVAQIGLSIIREDEGNLDAAIWHMERAYEIQPSNSAIQEELRRLYGRRDGIEPHKIRLTRGALVRLYIRGDLYQQAIAEAKSALIEDPDRLDLSILLAKCYDQLGKKVEAVETSTRVIKKLPYSYDANKIIAEVLSTSTKPEDAKPYLQRVNALDPYESHVSTGILNVSQVPDNAVTLERLEWLPSMDTNIQPEWVNSMGIQLPDEKTEEIDWKESIPDDYPTKEILPEAEQSQVEFEPGLTFVQESAAPMIPEQAEDLPDWMQEAGWEVSGLKGLETETDNLEIEQADDTDELSEIEPGEMPDWLREIAPPSVELEDETSEDLEKLDFLNQILPPPVEDLPEEGDAAAAAAGMIGAAEDLTNSTEEVPDWLSEIVQEDTQAVSDADVTGELAWDQAPQDSEPDEEKEKEIQEGLDWLERLAMEHGAEQETIISSPKKRVDTPPEWISEESPSEESAENLDEISRDWLVEQNVVEDETTSSEFSSFELPAAAQAETQEAALDSVPEEAVTGIDTIQKEDLIETDPTVLMDETVIMPEKTDELASLELSKEEDAFSWLESLAARQGADEATLVTNPEDRDTQTPEWVSEMLTTESPEAPEGSATNSVITPLPSWMEEPADFDQIVEETEPPVNFPESQTSTTSGSSTEEGKPLEIDDAAMGWLEALASKHGAEEGALSSNEDTRSETPPDWIRELSESEDQPVERAGVIEEPDAKDVLPDWIRELESESQTPIVLDNILETEEAKTDDSTPEIESLDPTPDWLAAMDASDNVSQEKIEETEQLPGLLSYSDNSSKEAEELAESQSLDWLDSISTIQDQGQPSEISEIINANEIEGSENESILMEGEQETAQPEPQPITELPDWLQELDNEITTESTEFDLNQEEKTTIQIEEPQVSVESDVTDDISSFVPSQKELDEIQAQMVSGEIDQALDQYAIMIDNNDQVDLVIEALQEASYRHPLNASILQTLGDAYAKSNMIKEALSAYAKAEELLLK
jgi:tetratricopeptide (TPR) repeat protein